MAMREAFVITCEHASNRVPRHYRKLFAGRSEILKTHRGYDIGALPLARHLAKRLHAPLFTTETTRLLVEVNRSPHHPAVFSEFSLQLPPNECERLLDAFYYPHRERVEFAVGALIDEAARVVHIGVHSFTPELDGDVREAAVGLLYDPQQVPEKEFCSRWQAALRDAAPDLRVRRNYPYRGAADGFTTYLRTRFPSGRYLGIELEVNQAMLSNRSEAIQMHRLLARTVPHSA